jgi:Pvc16 N-terminal domain
MIYDTLNFLRQQLEAFITEGRKSAEPLILLGSPWCSNDTQKNAAAFLNTMSLINLEEETFYKSQTPTLSQKQDGHLYRRNPDLKLNLYVLISAYHKNYEDGLKFLSRVVTFFQGNTVFNRQQRTEMKVLPECIEKLMIELYTATFEQQNQIWGSLSMGYVPSVIYKIRMLVLDTAPADQRVYPIEEIRTTF